MNTIKRQVNASLALLTVVLTGGAISLINGVVPATAQTELSCENTPIDVDSVPAAETTRKLKLEKFGIELTIPSNYRAMLLNNGDVQIVDPGTYKMIHCRAKGAKVLGRGYYSTVIRKVEKPDNLTLYQLIQNKKDPQDISVRTVDGKKGYLVEYQMDWGAEFWMDRKDIPGAVVIATRCDCKGMKEALVSRLESDLELIEQ